MARTQKWGRILTLALLLLGLIPQRTWATEADDVVRLVEGLQEASTFFDSLSAFEVLNIPIPLTEIAPGAPNALRLGTLWTESLSNTLATLSAGASYADLREAIADASGTYGGVVVSFADVTVAPNAGNAAWLEVGFDLTAQRTANLPFSFSDGVLDLQGSNLSVNLQLFTSLTFRLDTTQANSVLAWSIVGEPTVSIDALAGATLGSFSSELGFTTISVSGNATLNLDIDLTFSDPDSNGRITLDEWRSTALNDLVAAALVDEPGDAVSATLNLDTTLISGSPDRTITLTDSSLVDGFNPAAPTLGSLLDFANIEPLDVLNGLNQLLAGLLSAEGLSAPDLPFLGGSLADTFNFADPLIQFIRQQADGAIICGTNNSDPPSGTTTNLPVGTAVYCQAIALQNTSTVTWTISNGTVSANATNLNTVAPNPTANAAFSLTSAGRPLVKVVFSDSSGSHTVAPRFETAQELFAKLVELGGFDDAPANFNYDAATSSLTYRLIKTFDPPISDSLKLDFGNQLRAATNLIGLSPSGGASASIDPSNIQLDVTFGILLGDLATIPGGRPTDRFFIKVRSGADEYEFRADATFSANIALAGRLGFLEISAVGDASANPSGTAFTIAKVNPAKPMFGLNLVPPAGGIAQIGKPPIANALQLTQLLSTTSDFLAADVNIRMEGGIAVKATIGTPPTTLASGKVAINWPNITSGSPTVTADSDFSSKLKVFDINPGASGTHTGAANAATLTDSTKNFSAITGLVGATLHNETDGSTCTISVTTATTLACTLAGGTDNDWDTGDTYTADGNPLALLNVILDNLDELATLLDDVAGIVDLDAQLPLIGKSPRELITQFQNLRAVIDQIRAGSASAVLRCGTINSDPPSGDLTAVADGTTIFCQAQTSAFRVIEANWTISGGTTGANTAQNQGRGARGQGLGAGVVGPNSAFANKVFLPTIFGGNGTPSGTGVLATVGKNPTANAAFMVDDGDPSTATTNMSNVRIHLNFRGSGGYHLASFPPAGVPTSLQELEGVIETALNIPASAFGLELRDLPAPGSTNTDGVQDLVIRLGYGICTIGNPVCTASDQLTPKLEIPIRLDLGDDLAGLVGLSTDSSFRLEYAARAQLDLAIALAPTFNANSVVVVDTSGIQLSANASTENLNLTANVGPLTVALGTTVDISTTAGLQPGAGIAKIGASFSLLKNDIDGTPNNQTWTIPDFVGGLNADLGGPITPNDCTTIEPGAVVLIGDGCAKIALGLGSTYLGDLGFLAPELETSGGWQFFVPTDLASQIAGALLDWTLLLNALPPLLDDLEARLQTGAQDVSLPLIGDSLDAGADIVRTINDNVITPLNAIVLEINTVADVDDDGDSADPFDAARFVQEQLFTAIGPGSAVPLLLDGADANTTVELADIVITPLCGATPTTCANGASLTTISDFGVTFALGKGQVDPTGGCSANCLDPELPFNIGLPGLPLRSEGNVKASAGWKLLVDFGLSRNDGPYLVVSGPGHSGAELQVGASVGIGASTNCTLTEPDDLLTSKPELNNFSADRCLSGTLGFLQVTLRDGADATNATPSADDDATKLTLLGTMDITGNSGDRLSLAGLLGGGGGVDFGLVAAANVDLRIRTGLNVGQSAGFPSVLGAFHLTWNWDILDDPGNVAPSELRFSHLHLDLGKFLSDFLGEILREIKRVTGPLKPVIDTLQAPLPVLSDLSQLVGGHPITLISLMQAASGADLSLVRSIIALIQFINRIPTDGHNLLIPLSPLIDAFSVNPALAKAGPVSPDQAGNLVQNANPRLNLLDDIERATVVQARRNQPPGQGAFGVAGLSFPFLNNATEIFGVLMGKDVTLVHYDAGTLQATASINYTFGPIMVGPIPISIGLAGSATIKGRFAIGYDTSGLRKLLGTNGTRTDLFDGIFIDDLDANGMDVPEISLIGTVSASAALDLVIVAAGVEGGIRFTLDMNLNDSPNPDGKLRIEEIVSKLSNPICLFDISGKLEAFLAAFVRIGFAFFSKTFRIEIANITLLEFSSSCADAPPPNLAFNSGGDLRLNLGSAARRDDRHVATDEVNERFVVRQLNVEGTRFSIAAFGVYEEETIALGGRILADGEEGNDSVSLEAGLDEDNNQVPFTAVAIFNGGDGDDQFRTGGGADTVNGDAGNDKINAGDGADTINGGAGNDVLSGERGNDTANGNSDDDVIMGGSGADSLHGGPGDDSILGGPGTNTPNGPGDFPDEGDTITGGTGNDDVDGNFGADTVYGDEVLSCEAAGDPEGAGNDQVTGGVGNDSLFGGAGNDVVVGEEGDDLLCGNAGDDVLDGDAPAAVAATVLRVSARRGFALLPPVDGNDVLRGGADADELHGRGGDDDLFGNAGDDTLYGETDNDDLSGGADNDTLEGAEGRDYLFGDDGAALRPAGQLDATSVVFAETGGGNDTLRGAAGADVAYGEGGNDTMYGDADADQMWGNGGADSMRGGTEPDQMWGGGENDAMWGDSGADQMWGNANDDTMRGGIGDDYLEGNQDNDTMTGDADHDDMLGGSSDSELGDGDDVMDGNVGQDVLVGDNGSITRPGGTYPFDGALLRTVTLLNPEKGGDDIMHGNEDNDRMWGGAANDQMWGDEAHDYLEGNPGNDTMFGNAGQDDLLGGSSTAGFSDGDDVMEGNDDFDVLAGDNATLTRDGTFNTFEPSFVRVITLLDITLGGNDTMWGNAANDDLYGGAANDQMHGNDGDDYLEGNPDNDIMFGELGQDDLIGGTTQGGGTIPDGDDQLYGGAGQGPLASDFDVLTGDNASIVRPLQDGQWITETFSLEANGIVQRRITLYDVATTTFQPAAETSGDDVLRGEDDRDLLYGQGANDTLYGGTGDDWLEGNAANDTMLGEAGQDDLIGGSYRTTSDDPLSAVDGRLDGDDQMAGGDTINELTDDFDVLLGDNGEITRLFGSDDQWLHNTFNAAVAREVWLFDVGFVNWPAGIGSGGADTMRGEASDDWLFGQAANDSMSGGSGDDWLEGNAANDTMLGDRDQDDMIGGTSQGAGNAFDGDDLMWGGELRGNGGDETSANDYDVLTGDNAAIIRPLSAGQWIRDTFALSTTNVVRRSVRLYDVQTISTNRAAEQNAEVERLIPSAIELDEPISGDDTLQGQAAHDLLYGQGANDTLRGGGGDDAVEGNAGADMLYGDAGQDDLIGGTGRTISDDPTSAFRGRVDGADKIWGGSNGSDLAGDFDVIMGDNATIIRPLDGSGRWRTNTFNASLERDLRLFDVGEFGSPAGANTSGGDLVYGEANDDVMYGQGGNDTLWGGGGDDYVEGNTANDQLRGGLGNDDLIGGTGRINEDPPSGQTERLDGGDTIHGDAGFDVLAGDNALIARTLVGGLWQPNTFNAGIQHQPRLLLDLNSPNTNAVAGGDTLFGEDDDDLLYGQFGIDILAGNNGDDLLEGNGGNDTLNGNAGQDDVIGGSAQAGQLDGADTLLGSTEADVLVGDNGTIARPLVGGLWQRQTFAGDTLLVVKRAITLFDGAKTSAGTPSPTLSGGDRMLGDTGRDLLFGGGNGGTQPTSAADPLDGIDNDRDGVTDEDQPWLGDEMRGGDGDDWLEGNGGIDWLLGEAGQDDLVGGSSSGNGVIGGGVAPTNERDLGDILAGGLGDDVLLGDNGTVSRPLDGAGLWTRTVGGALALDQVIRSTTMAQIGESAGAWGNDYLRGDDGHDDEYGQLGADYLEGNRGQDALVGDLGQISNRLENGSRQQTITLAQPTISKTIFAAGTLTRLTRLYAFTGNNAAGGADILLGGDDNDSLHSGPGNDIINGDGDIDVAATLDADQLFAGDGDDVLWGGRGDDVLWGGYNKDYLDVKPRAGDPAAWQTFGGSDYFQGVDIVYGGWNQDALQANLAGDRLLDWVNSHNRYYSCPAASGLGVITSVFSNNAVLFLQKLAAGGGAFDPTVSSASGFREAGIVFANQTAQNTNPAHPDSASNFVCGE